MMSPRLLRTLLFAAVVCAAARPADASSITVVVGDKDGFGGKLTAGQLPCSDPTAVPPNPCLKPIQDWRTAAEQIATNGAQLTDVYSALYDPATLEYDCGTGFQICSPNGATGTVVFPFSGTLTSASITMFIGDFQSNLFNAMLANINGVPVSFFYADGLRNTSLRTIFLTPAMLAAANLAGEVQLFLDHGNTCGLGPECGSFDYVAFDYFELNANPAVPEPGTWLLIGTGLAALTARRLRRSR